jgi:hypothetical protein
MPRVGFEPKIPLLEQAKTFHAFDRAVTVIGAHDYTYIISKYKFFTNLWGRTYGEWVEMASQRGLTQLDTQMFVFKQGQYVLAMLYL